MEAPEDRFEDLPDETAEKVALAFGLYKWSNREELNRLWQKFEDSLKGERT